MAFKSWCGKCKKYTMWNLQNWAFGYLYSCNNCANVIYTDKKLKLNYKLK